MHVVTTFNDLQLPLYGDRFIENFQLYWPCSGTVYAERFQKPNTDKLEFVDYYKTIPEHNIFKSIVEQKLPVKDKKTKYRLKKALRWSFKAYAIIHALENIDTDYVVWLDADVNTMRGVPANFAENKCGKQLLYCYKDVIRLNGLHIESGMVIFNKQHDKIHHIIEGYKTGYHEQKVFSLPKPWDGYWLAKIIQPMQKDVTMMSPPFRDVKGIMHHDVGKAKFQGKKFDNYLNC